MTDSLRERVLNQQEQRTSLMDKLADLTDEEWEELTHRLQKHFGREMEKRGYALVRL